MQQVNLKKPAFAKPYLNEYWELSARRFPFERNWEKEWKNKWERERERVCIFEKVAALSALKKLVNQSAGT